MVFSGNFRGMVFPLFFVISLVFIRSDVMAQTKVTEDRARPNSLVAGAWAMQFEVGKDFSIEDFQDFLISVKKHITARKAVRVGFGFSGESAILTSSNSYFDADTSFESTYNGPEENSQTFDLVVQFVSVPAPDKEANLFFGFGPVVRFSHTGSETEYQNLTYRRDMKTWVLGTAGILGVEWFATKSISFLAEYGLAFEYVNTTNTSIRVDYRIPERTESGIARHSIRFEPNPLKVGLSVYF